MNPLSKKKEKSLSALITELDGYFSRFIRKRDTVNGVIKCFTCGARLTFAEAQAAHFIDRDQMPVRYDEHNVHSCCQHCNCHDPDHKKIYYGRMLQKYGQEEVTRLQRKSKGLQKFFKWEVEDLIEYYKSENRLKP